MAIKFNEFSISKAKPVVKAGDIAKKQVAKLFYNKTMENIMGQSDKDYFKLTHPIKNKKSNIANKSFIDGLKNFLENGCMF